MENQNIVTIHGFINDLWKWIKNTEIPPQSNDIAWDHVVQASEDLCRDYRTSDPLHRLFRAWVVDYLEYLSDVSKGVPTLMQEANEAKKAVM